VNKSYQTNSNQFSIVIVLYGVDKVDELGHGGEEPDAVAGSISGVIEIAKAGIDLGHEAAALNKMIHRPEVN
jgi:hypothetical protein